MPPEVLMSTVLRTSFTLEMCLILHAECSTYTHSDRTKSTQLHPLECKLPHFSFTGFCTQTHGTFNNTKAVTSQNGHNKELSRYITAQKKQAWPVCISAERSSNADITTQIHLNQQRGKHKCTHRHPVIYNRYTWNPARNNKRTTEVPLSAITDKNRRCSPFSLRYL